MIRQLIKLHQIAVMINYWLVKKRVNNLPTQCILWLDDDSMHGAVCQQFLGQL